MDYLFWCWMTIGVFGFGFLAGCELAERNSVCNKTLLARGVIRYELKSDGKPVLVWCVDGKPVEGE